MKYLTITLLPLLAAMATPALAAEPPEPPTAQEAEVAVHAADAVAEVKREIGEALGDAARTTKPTEEAKTRAQLELTKLAAFNEASYQAMDADAENDSTYASELRSLISFVQSKSANTELTAGQIELLRDIAKNIFERGRKFDAYQINWLKTPAMMMTPEEARLAGYPCLGPNGETEVSKKMRDAAAAAADATLKHHRQSTSETRRTARKHIALHDHDAKSADCDDCPDCADGTCTEAAHTKSAHKDFDCVDCPEAANV